MPLIKSELLSGVLSDLCYPISLREIFKNICRHHPEVSTHFLTNIKTAIDAGMRYGYVDKINDQYHALTYSVFEDLSDQPSHYELERSDSFVIKPLDLSCSGMSEAVDTDQLGSQSDEGAGKNQDN
ncbi:uncharacterized protein LOC119644974 [Glossina fuscipes]|uniref:Uncharacterized protein LOC119644974 n=1 Tax=Glossina fuscipes TaxID=7396 RepID=A0A9C5ZPE6_9MUSC|nr:uncharacterized protein LOC119644974 [Glossina fuscipes]